MLVYRADEDEETTDKDEKRIYKDEY